MYPDKPLLAVSAFVVRESEDAGTEVLLVKRSKEPAAGAWALPGGNVEVGESLVEAAKREVKEECEIEIRDVQEAEGNSAVKRMALPSKPTPFLAVDGIDKDDKGDVRWHYVIVQVAGEPVDPRQNANPKDDAADAHWMALDKVRRGEVENLVPGVMNVAEAAMRSFRSVRACVVRM